MDLPLRLRNPLFKRIATLRANGKREITSRRHRLKAKLSILGNQEIHLMYGRVTDEVGPCANPGITNDDEARLPKYLQRRLP